MKIDNKYHHTNSNSAFVTSNNAATSSNPQTLECALGAITPQSAMASSTSKEWKRVSTTSGSSYCDSSFSASNTNPEPAVGFSSDTHKSI